MQFPRLTAWAYTAAAGALGVPLLNAERFVDLGLGPIDNVDLGALTAVTLLRLGVGVRIYSDRPWVGKLALGGNKIGSVIEGAHDMVRTPSVQEKMPTQVVEAPLYASEAAEPLHQAWLWSSEIFQQLITML